MSFFNRLQTTGLVSLAVALAAAALPGTALAQDDGQGRHGDGRGGEAHGSWNGGGHGNRGTWNGGNGGGANGGAGTATPNHEMRRGGGNWQSNGGASWRQSQPSVQQPVQQARPRWQGSPDGASQGWANRTARTQRDNSEWRARQAELARNWSRQDASPQSGTLERRNRTYSDPNRSGTYQTRRQRGDGDNRWRNDNVRREQWRSRNDTWRSGNNWNRDGRRYSDNRRAWDRDWRRDNRYNWYSYRSHNRDHYRMGRYYAPYSGWTYRRLGIGFMLNDMFYSNRYWIDDPWSYRLPEADGPYRWVRYYDDALLVDIYSGEVVDVIYDFFW